MEWQDFLLVLVGLLGGVGLSRGLSGLTQMPISPDPTPAKTPAEPVSDIEQLRLTCQRLASVERFKSGFLARTAHELRSPINSLIGLHQLILEDLCEDPAEEREFIGQAKAAALKVLSLLDRLIAASKLDIGREAPQLEAMPLFPIFQSVQALTQLQAANRNVRLTVTLPPPALQVVSDPQWLSLLLVNLVEDAISTQPLGVLHLWSELHTSGQVAIYLQTERLLTEIQAAESAAVFPELPTPDLAQPDTIRLSTGLMLMLVRTLASVLGAALTWQPGPADPETARMQLLLPGEETVGIIGK